MGRRVKFRINNKETCESIIRGTFHGVLTFGHESEPYAVPINHAYEDGYFYFHCAPGEKKIDYIKRNPSVVYTIMKYYGTAHDFRDRQNCHGKWESVIVYGKNDFKPSESSLQETRAIVMKVDRMTARRELETKETEFYEWEV